MNKGRCFNLRINSTALILYLVVFSVLLISEQHPLYIALYVLIEVAFFILLNKISSFLKVLKFSVYLGLMILSLNLILSGGGASVIFETPSIPLVGVFQITKESLVFSLVMCLKLLGVLSVFALYGELVSTERSLSFFSKLLPQSTLMIVLSVLFIPQIKRRLESIKLVLKFRGVDLNRGGLVERFKSACLLLKVVFLTALEGSWQSAEALEAKAYGVSSRRTSILKEKWDLRSSSLLAFSGLSFCIWIFWLVNGKTKVEFYPESYFLLTRSDVFFFSLIFVLIALLPLACLVLPSSEGIKKT